MRALVLAALVVGTACGAPVAAPGPSATDAPVATASPEPATATPAPSPSLTARVDPTAPPLRYASDRGYRVDLPPGWRPSDCLNESFTPATIAEESGSDIGPHQEVVSVYVEDPTSMTPRQWLERLGGSVDDRIDDTTLDGKPAVRLMNTASGLVIGYALASGGGLYAIVRAYARFRPAGGQYDAVAAALMSSFHVLTPAERQAAAAARRTPTAAPARPADEVVRTLARGFAQRDTAVLATVAAPCLTHAIEQAGPYWATTTKMLGELAQAFARGLTVSVGSTVEQGPYATYVRGTWDDPTDRSLPHRNIQVWIAQRGSAWYWTGWMDLQPVR